MGLRIVFMLFFLSSTTFCQERGVYEFDENLSALNLIPFTQHLGDSTNAMNLKEVLIVHKTNKFANSQASRKLSFGMDHANHWTHTQFRNNSNKVMEIVLDLGETAILDQVSWYIFEDDSLLIVEENISWETPYYKRPLISRYQAIAFQAKPSKKYTCILLTQRDIGVSSLVLNLNEKTTFHKKYLQRFFFSYLIFGTAIFLFFVVLALYFLTKKMIYLAFSFHAIVLFVHLFHRFGFFNMFYFETPKIWMGPHGLFLSTSLLMVSAIFLTHQFIPVKKLIHAKYLYVGHFLMGLTLFYIIFYFQTYLSNPNYRFVYFILLVILAYLLSLLFYGMYKKDRSSFVFFLAISYLLFSSLFIGDKLLLGEGYLSLYNNIFLAYFWEIVVFSTALIYQFIRTRDKALSLSLELSKSQDSIIVLQEKERQKIATNLHDDLGGTLSALKGQATEDGLKTKTLHLIDRAIMELRSISRNLLPPEFAKYGLTEAIRHNISNLNNSGSIKFSYISFGKEENFKTERKLNVYRIVSELTNNIIKHSNGKNAIIQLIFHEDYLFVSVEDDGSTLEDQAEIQGIGLKSINSRLGYLQAIVLQTPNKHGFSYAFEIPYKAPEISTL